MMDRMIPDDENKIDIMINITQLLVRIVSFFLPLGAHIALIKVDPEKMYNFAS